MQLNPPQPTPEFVSEVIDMVYEVAPYVTPDPEAEVYFPPMDKWIDQITNL